MSDFIPHHSVEAEMYVLGHLILNSAKSPKKAIGLGLGANHFYRPSNRVIYRTIITLHEAGVKPDIAAVKGALEKSGDFVDVGGIDYLMNVCEATPMSNLEHWVGAVLDAWRLRETIALGREAENGTMDPLTLHMRLDNIKEGAKGGVPDLETFRLGFMDTSRHEGVASGFPALDEMTVSRGYPNGQTTNVTAYHKAGKSAFMLQSAHHVATLGKPVLYATFADLAAKPIQARIMKMRTAFSSPEDIRELEVSNYWWAELKKLQALPFHIYSPVERRLPRDIEVFLPWLERKMEQHEFAAIYMDYAQRIRSNSRKATTEYAEAGIVADLIQEAAQTYDIPIILGAQITEGGKDGRDRTKGSRVWEENAGLVVRIKTGETDNTRDVEVPYNRFGPSGKFGIQWEPKYARFGETF